MNRPSAVTFTLLLAALLPHGMSAQVAVKVQAGALETNKDGELPASSMTVSPDVRYTLPYLSLSARGSAWLGGQQWQIADGGVSASLNSPTIARFRGEL